MKEIRITTWSKHNSRTDLTEYVHYEHDGLIFKNETGVNIKLDIRFKDSVCNGRRIMTITAFKDGDGKSKVY